MDEQTRKEFEELMIKAKINHMARDQILRDLEGPQVKPSDLPWAKRQLERIIQQPKAIPEVLLKGLRTAFKDDWYNRLLNGNRP